MSSRREADRLLIRPARWARSAQETTADTSRQGHACEGGQIFRESRHDHLHQTWQHSRRKRRYDTHRSFVALMCWPEVLAGG